MGRMHSREEMGWEENTFAGLEELDEAGRDRVSHLGRLDVEEDEPDMVASALPVMDELELDDAPHLA